MGYVFKDLIINIIHKVTDLAWRADMNDSRDNESLALTSTVLTPLPANDSQ